MVIRNKVFGTKDYITGAIYFRLNNHCTILAKIQAAQTPVHGVMDIHLNPRPSSIGSPVLVKSLTTNGNNLAVTILDHGLWRY